MMVYVHRKDSLTSVENEVSEGGLLSFFMILSGLGNMLLILQTFCIFTAP